MKKRRISQDNTKTLNSQKDGSLTIDASARHLYEEYYCLKTFKPVPVNLAWIEQLGQREYKWATTDPEALVMNQFYVKEGISKRQYLKWVEKYPSLAEWHRLSLEALGARRELGGVNKKYSEKIITYTARAYDDDWIKLDDEHSKQRQTENAVLAGNTMYINMEKAVHKPLPENDHFFVTKTKETK